MVGMIANRPNICAIRHIPYHSFLFELSVVIRVGVFVKKIP